MSISLGDNIHKGSEKGYPKANLGYFQSGQETENADNVFVLVVHYDFKDTKGSLAPRLGDEKDVENLRVAFEKNRNCAFRELLSPKKDDLLNFLKDEHNLKLYFGAPPDEPAVFFLIILSHGDEDGVIYTDTLLSLNTKDEYETFTTEDVFKSIRDLFPKCLKGIFFGPCRGLLEEKVEKKYYHTRSETEREKEHAKNRNACRITFEPNMRNLFILYSTVETTVSQRRVNTGTWLVECLCEQLNKMGQSEDVLQFFTAIQNKIHHKTIAAFGSKGQTPELKMFTCDRRFFFRVLGPNNAVASTSSSGSDAKFVKIGSQEVVEPQSNHFNWRDAESKTLRRKFAAIFYHGRQTYYVSRLEAALSINLGFDTKTVKIDKELEDYFTNRNEQSWNYYGCFAAFFFAEIAEGNDGEVCIQVSEKESIPVGELLHRLLGPKNAGWIGKPKLFFLLHTKLATTDCANTAKRLKLEKIILQATKNSGWLVLVLQNIDEPHIQKFVEIFGSQEIKQMSSPRSLQHHLVDFLTAQSCTPAGGPDAMMVSTLHCLLTFPKLDKSFLKPKFIVGFKEDEEVSWDRFLDKFITEQNRIFLLPSFAGSGKSTVMSELAFEVERKFKGAIKVFLVVLIQTWELFYNAIEQGRKVPSLASVVSLVSGTLEKESQNLINEKKIMLMFDGFDEISPFYRDECLQVFDEATKEKLPIWISTRPHEEGAILAKLGTGNEVCRVQIMPLDLRKQIDLFMMISDKSEVECRRRIEFYRKNGLEDILGNALHLQMIASLEDCQKGFNLYNLYEKIVDNKLRLCLGRVFNLGHPASKGKLYISKLKLGFVAVKFISGCANKSLNYYLANNGIATISDGRAQFVHQTFAEYLAAAHFIDYLLKREKMPFEIMKNEFRQVRKFFELGISMRSSNDKSKLLEVLKMNFKKCLSKSDLENFILRENLATFASVAAKLITFDPNDDTNDLNYATTDHLLVLACERDENFALELLNNNGFEKLTDPNTCTVEMLAGAIRNNFVRLFSKIEEKCSILMDLVQTDKSSIHQAVVEAVGENYHQIVQLLLEKGIVNASDKDNFQTALRTAVEKNSVECVQLLIENTPRTAFLDVTAFGSDDFFINIETTKALLNTNDELKSRLASRIFNSAVKCANVEVAMFLLEKYGNNVEDADFKVSPSALLDVSKWDDSHDKAVELCRWLVEKRRFKVYENDVKGHDAIFYAEKRGNSELCTYLKER